MADLTRRLLARLRWWLHPGHSPEPSADTDAPRTEYPHPDEEPRS